MSSVVSPPARWTHHDEQLTAHLEAGMARSRARDWQSGPLASRVAELQAVVVETAYQMAKLAGSTSRVPTAGGETLYIDPRPAAGVPAPRREFSALLYRTLDLLAQDAQQTEAETYAHQETREAAGLPAVALVALIVVGGAAIAYCGQQAIKVVDRSLARDARAAEVMANHAALLDVIDAHTAREDAAGKQIPLDAASRVALDSLGRAQETLAGKSLPDFGDFGGGLLPTTARPWSFTTGALLGLGLAAALLLVTKSQGVI